MSLGRNASEDAHRKSREALIQDRLYAEWLRLRAAFMSCQDAKDHDADADLEELRRIERDLCSAPCVSPWRLFRKFEVLRKHAVETNHAAGGLDDVIQMIGDIEADLIRIGINNMVEPYNGR